MALMLPTINKLFRKYDTRITITACMALEGIAYLIDSMAQNVWVFYINGFFLGGCLSMLIYLIIPVLINNWFVKNTGLWIGICGAAQGIAGAVFSSLGAASDCIKCGKCEKVCPQRLPIRDNLQLVAQELEAFNALKNLTNTDDTKESASGLSTDYWKKKD